MLDAQSGREPPHDFESEQALLGSLLFDNNGLHLVSEITLPEHFADPLHGKLYTWMSSVIGRGDAATPVTLRAFVDQDPAMAAAGGAGYLGRLLARSTPIGEIPSLARHIRDLFLRRQVITLAEEAIAAAYRPSVETTALSQIEQLERGLYDLASRSAAKGEAKAFATVVDEVVKAAEAAYRRGGSISGLSTGYAVLDSMLGGLHRSDLIILAGRPSMGKTALATNIAFRVAKAYREEVRDGSTEVVAGGVVVFFSLEMSSDQLGGRIISERANVPSHRVRQGHMSAVEFDRYLSVGEENKPAKMLIDDTPGLTITALRTRARRLQRQHGLGLIVVDYLQLLDGSNRRDGRTQEISEITRGLKTIAKELDVPVLALSQLSRAVEQRPDKKPQLSDLRESGSIEQDADVVAFVYREEYYIERGPQKGSIEHINAMGQADVIIAKQRHGPTGSARMRFDGALMRFDDPEGAAADTGSFDLQ